MQNWEGESRLSGMGDTGQYMRTLDIFTPQFAITPSSGPGARTSAKACSLPLDTVIIVTWEVCAAASSRTETTRVWTGPTPRDSRGKLRAITDSRAVCFCTLKGTMAGPVICEQQTLSSREAGNPRAEADLKTGWGKA